MSTTRTTQRKVLVSRPHLTPAPPSPELRRADFCWTLDGELLTYPDIPCDDTETCGCGWSFAGITSARACSWGVVELRSTRTIAAEVAGGKHLAGWSVVEGFEAHLLAAIADIGDRVRFLPLGAMVGVWALDENSYGLFDRTPNRRSRGLVGPSPTRSRWPRAR